MRKTNPLVYIKKINNYYFMYSVVHKISVEDNTTQEIFNHVESTQRDAQYNIQ